MRPPRAGRLLGAGLVPICAAVLPAHADAEPRPPLMPLFEEVAAADDVPLPLLLVLAKLGSGFEDRRGAPTIEGGYGLMALRDNTWGGDSLRRAARLLGREPRRLIADEALNLQGAAAVLGAWADEAGIDRSRGLDAWRPVVVRYAGLDPQASEWFADEVFDTLARGFVVKNQQEELFEVEPAAGAARGQALATGDARLLSPDYPPALWDPAPACNYQAVPTGKDLVVIHMAEGTAAGARAWYRTCAAGESIHYVASESGSIWQMVAEAHVARHAECLDPRAIGIVHEGFSTSPSHPDALYHASAVLCRHLCAIWTIPVIHSTDGTPGLLGHDDAGPLCSGSTPPDPGAGWDWPGYLQKVAMGGVGPIALAAASGKEHGLAGRFDLDVLGAAAVENRAGGPTSLSVTFNVPVLLAGGPPADAVRVSTGAVTDVSADGCTIRVAMNGAADGCRLAVSFPGVTDAAGTAAAGCLSIGVLRGDVDGDGRVDLQDLMEMRLALIQDPCGTNLRYDVDLSGRVGSCDLLAVRGRLGAVLSPQCP